MKVLAIAGAAVAVLAAGQAYSADLPARMYTKAAPVAYLPWNNCYVGVTLGYTKQETTPTLSTIDPNLLASVVADNVNTRPGVDPDGVIGGGTVGCNRQYDRVVVSIETDVSGTSARSRFSSVQGPNTVSNLGSQETNVLGTLRGRLGYAVDRTLFYGTAGLAYGHLNNSFAIIPSVVGAPQLGASENTWKAGWTAGGGIEHMFAPNWSAKAEYLYYDLGNSNIALVTVAGAPNESGVLSYKNTGHIVRAGLNYHFNAF